MSLVAASPLFLNTDGKTIMANTSSAKKNVRKMETQKAVNQAVAHAFGPSLRRVEDALTAGDKAAQTRSKNSPSRIDARGLRRSITRTRRRGKFRRLSSQL